MYIPQVHPYQSKAGLLHGKEWKISDSFGSDLNRIFCSRVSLEGHTHKIKSSNSIENLREMIQLPSDVSYNRKELVAEQLEIIRNTSSDPSLQRFADYLAGRENGLQKLGMLLWHLDRRGEALKLMMSKKEWDNIESWIEKSFSREVDRIESRLDQTLQNNRKTDIQSTRLVKSTLIPREIAAIIITQQADINIGLLEYVKDALIKRNRNSFSYDVSLTQTVILLLKSKNLRIQLTSINPPLNPQSPAATVIRAALGLLPSEPITRVHAVQTVAAALLSHLRQQEKRSCFAAFLAINMKQSHLKRCIDDFNSLLQYSHLSRQDSGICEHFPFLLKMSNSDLSNEFTSGNSLWDSAGLAAACRIMGIDDAEKVLGQISEEIGRPATAKKVIEKLALHAAESSENNTAADFYQKGCFAFGSATFNPLLKVWVNAIAGMAESQANCFFGSCILKTIMTVFHKHLSSKKLTSESMHDFEKQLQSRFASAIQMIYDPSIGALVESAEGGFVLYEGHEEGEFRRLRRIDNGGDFNRFVLQILRSCGQNKKFTPLAESLESLVLSPTFSETILTAYNKILSHHLDKTEQKIVSVPWINHLGHSASDIMRVYLDHGPDLKPKILIPKKGKTLLRKLIVMGKHLDKIEKDKLKQNPHLLKPARILNYHAFSLMIGHASLQKAWRDKRVSRKWVEDEISSYGLEVSHSIISKKQRSLLMNNFGVSDLPKNITIKQFRKYLLKSTSPLTPETKLEVDKLIVETLPHDLKEKLNKTIIHFADTNLHSGMNDIHFCFIVNPGTGKIEVWQITDDNSKIMPLDQNLIVKNKTWEIYLYPDELIN
jgi:hypothetical protein